MIEVHSQKRTVGGVILAAGAASRMGQPKLLLPWKGEALIRHAVHTALSGGLSPVVVVTGANAAAVRSTVEDMDVLIADNPEWKAGQSTSVRVGIQALPTQAEAVVFLLADQPFVTKELLQALVTTFFQTRPLILAPTVGGKRTNPVLFDRQIFKILVGLEGDAGARSIFGQYPPTPLPWEDDRLFFDIDTPEDYNKLIGAMKSD